MFKEYSKYLTNRNVAILGTVSFHAFLLAIFTHINIDYTDREESATLMINFTEEQLDKLLEEDIEESIEDPESNINILDEFSGPVSNQASSLSSENTVEELRSSMKSLENVRNEDVDLFSDEAVERDIPTKQSESVTDGVGEEERKVENAFTGKSTINYFLEGRYSDRLPNPIYTCIDGGKIHIDIKVNQQGRVIEAKYNKGKSNSKNECLIETALKYARRSKFNTDFNSAETQKGYINYLFHKN